ncbi:MAG: hypothetical protein LQ343_006104 [Gyalolechia ehrenbergii]|nr:MAG: hypothetical protein LQ343_006104 [Gyalolechia ehrenbergii]
MTTSPSKKAKTCLVPHEAATQSQPVSSTPSEVEGSEGRSRKQGKTNRGPKYLAQEPKKPTEELSHDDYEQSRLQIVETWLATHTMTIRNLEKQVANLEKSVKQHKDALGRLSKKFKGAGTKGHSLPKDE